MPPSMIASTVGGCLHCLSEEIGATAHFDVENGDVIHLLLWVLESFQLVQVRGKLRLLQSQQTYRNRYIWVCTENMNNDPNYRHVVKLDLLPPDLGGSLTREDEARQCPRCKTISSSHSWWRLSHGH